MIQWFLRKYSRKEYRFSWEDKNVRIIHEIIKAIFLLQWLVYQIINPEGIKETKLKIKYSWTYKTSDTRVPACDLTAAFDVRVYNLDPSVCLPLIFVLDWRCWFWVRCFAVRNVDWPLFWSHFLFPAAFAPCTLISGRFQSCSVHLAPLLTCFLDWFLGIKMRNSEMWESRP